MPKLSDYVAQRGTTKMQPLKREQAIVAEKAQRENKSFLERLISPITPIATGVDVVEDVLGGLSKGVEGIVDYGMGLVGTVGSVFGSDKLEDAMTNAIKYDFTGNTVRKIDDWAETSSWLGNDTWLSNTAHQVGEGVGQMLPAIAVTYFTGGAGASAAAASLAGTATFAASAGGGATEEALHEGANIKQATAYGTLVGATEGAIEYATGKLGGLNPYTKGAASKMFSGGLGKAVKTFAEEGAEEVASGLITPAWKAITYSGKYETPEINELVQSFTTGGLTALAMGGAGKVTNIAKYGVEGERAVSTYNEILELNEKEYNLEKNGKLTQEQSTEFAKQREALVKELNEHLNKVDQNSKNYERLYGAVTNKQALEFNVKKQAIYETVDALNKKYRTNLNVEFVNKDTLSKYEDVDSTVDGYVKGNTIYINEDSADPYSSVLAHELTHTTENKELYNELAKDILSSMSEAELTAKQNEIRELYKSENPDDPDAKPVSTEFINQEIVADYISKMLGSDSKTLLNTFTRKPNLVTRVLEWIEEKLLNTSKKNAEYEQYKKYRDKIREVMSSKEITKETLEQNTETKEKFYRKKREDYDFDSNGEVLTEEQQEYFENSKVRDEETGGLQIVYHGTKWAGFTVFDARESGNGNYRFGNEVVNFFTDSDEMAGSYTSRNRKEQKYFKTFDNMTIERANELLSDYGEKTGDPTIRLVKGKDLKIKREGYNPDYLYIEYDDGNSVLSRDGYKSMTQAVNEGFVETQLAFGEDGETELFLFLEKEIGDVYEGYLNIENPYVVDAKGRFWNDIVDPELEEKYIKKGSEVVEKYENKEINKNTTTNLMKDLENIGLKVELIDENSDGFVVMFEESSVLMFKNGETFSGQTLTNLQKVIKQRAYETKTTNQFVFRALNKAAKGENYDGVIIKNVIDYGDYRDNMQPHNIYISTKSPSQFKLKDNKTPTGDPDIRFSRKRRTPPPGQMELDLSIGQVVPVEQNPIATIEEQASFAETREKNPKQKTNVNVEETIKQTSEQVKSKMPKENQTVGEKVTTAYKAIEEFFNNRNAYILNLQIQLTNSFAGVEKRAKDFYTEKFTNEGLTGTTLKNKVNEELTKLKALQLKAVRTDAGANYTLKNDLYDGIWKGINAKGAKYTNLFETFLLHRLNVKRMRYKWLDPQVRKQLNTMLNNGEINQEQYDMFVEEAKHIEKKKLFKDIVDENGNKKEVTAEVSEEILAQMEKEHPEFVKLADKVYHYLNMLMDIREQAGIVSKQQRAFMKEHYGDWYVPSYRENEYGATTSGLSGKGAIGVSKGIHGAKGSELDIQSIMSSMAKQTMGVYKQAVMNELFQKVQEIAPDAFEETSVARQTRKDMDGEIEPKKNEVYFYKDGKRTTYKTTDDIAAAFKTLRNDKSNNLENNYVAKGLEKLVSIMKKVTTEYNPFFAVRNLFRDASDTFIYTKYSPNLIKRYNRALQEIRNNGEYYKLYQMNGGNAFSFFDQENGLDLRKKNKILNAISTVNEITELLPRLSEFMESVDAHYSGKLSDIDQQTVDMAMLDASEVTVNFARGGTFTKKLNKYLMPYLNASVQGWCKTWNTFVHPTSMRAWGMSMAKIVLMALPTLIFNEIWYDDDEEYQQLSDDIKGSYFLIKTGNNKFIRIPRGRVEAVVGDAMQRIYRSAKGEENAFEGYAKNTLKNVSPIDNMTRTILSPVTDVTTNTTWYGGQIENRAMQELPVQERYDANTSSIAKALNKIVPSVSPKKWHYLLDQYSGILGDVVLPLTSQNKSLSGISGLKVDSLSNNKYTNEFYKTIEEIEQTRNSSKGTAVDKAKMRYMNKMNTKINELYKAKRTTNDKEEQEALQALIVKLQKDAVVSVKEFEKVLKKYEYGLSQDELYDDYYREANRECFGAEVALMDYDGRVYEKACIFNKCGINWDTFYNVYFDAQDIMADYDADGNVVSGSKKQKVTQYVKSLNLNATQKYMIMGLLGYKNTNGESQVRSLLRSKGYTGEELENIMKICGYGK